MWLISTCDKFYRRMELNSLIVQVIWFLPSIVCFFFLNHFILIFLMCFLSLSNFTAWKWWIILFFCHREIHPHLHKIKKGGVTTAARGIRVKAVRFNHVLLTILCSELSPSIYQSLQEGKYDPKTGFMWDSVGVLSVRGTHATKESGWSTHNPL